MTAQADSPVDNWLVVIDAQLIFADPQTSQWGSPMWADTVPRIRTAVEWYGDRVVFTRFVADPDPRGSWVDYYRQWPFAQVPDSDPLYAVVPELAEFTEQVPVITAPTFGKWPAIAETVGLTPRLTLAGVSTDCCVLSTALAAADAGATIRIASDLCAGSTSANHDRALAAIELYGPQITVV
ncbi:nicotinamidase [Flexivirga endophytica]|uniref:Nicotinamidase n=1 Tax=Flexivirga endophytica TaxID=1849103 RepID=A0A916T2A4_9MICO|nr:isochorismatase family protein [Flexivirga endophytica]GGB25363.1 nicotinamidase [Flexivirga endophytica]GHB53922.1 nicotinamidase [Flexivirga endophytica]